MCICQACRGERTDCGEVIRCDATDSGGGVSLGTEEDCGPGVADICHMAITIPTEADIFVAYSTPPGYYSYRSDEGGSYFMQLLSYRLYSNGHLQNDDLNKIMTLVSQDMINFQSSRPAVSSMRNKKQVPWVSSTLSKMLKF